MFKGNNRATTSINGVTHYILHKTSIVQESTNKIVLNSGGWTTATTKKALNEVGNFLNFSVYQKKRIWYVDFKGKTFEFSDNMELVK